MVKMNAKQSTNFILETKTYQNNDSSSTTSAFITFKKLGK